MRVWQSLVFAAAASVAPALYSEVSKGVALTVTESAPAAVEFPVVAQGRVDAFSWRVQSFGSGQVLLTLEDARGRFHVTAVKVPESEDGSDPALRDGDGWVLSPISVNSSGHGLYGLSFNANPVALVAFNPDGTFTIHLL